MTSINAYLKTMAEEEAAGSDSDKSLSTNEHSFPTASGGSSGLNSANNGACSPPTMSSRSVRANTRCSYESSKHEIVQIDGVTTVTQASTSPLKRQRISTVTFTQDTDFTKRSLF